MFEIPKKYLHTISWINILFGSFHILAYIVTSSMLYFRLLPQAIELSLIDYIIPFLLAILLVISGYTLLNTKKKIKHIKTVSWLCIIYGFSNFVVTLLMFSQHGVQGTVNVYENITVTLLSEIILVLPHYMLLTISGFMLRKISR